MEKLLGAFIFLKERWVEPSTHAALSSICTSIGISFPENMINHYMLIAGIAFGLSGFWLKESKAITKV